MSPRFPCIRYAHTLGLPVCARYIIEAGRGSKEEGGCASLQRHHILVLVVPPGREGGPRKVVPIGIRNIDFNGIALLVDGPKRWNGNLNSWLLPEA